MPLPRIPPPPRPATATPPQQQQQQQQQQPTQLGHGDLLASFDQEQVPPTDTNPHLQMYNGPTAAFFSSPSAPEPATQTNPQPHNERPRQTQHTAHSPPHTHTHTHTHSRHPPRRLSQIFSSLGPASPPVVSEQAGNGFILPPHHHHHPTNHAISTSTSDVPGNDEFGAFTSAAASSSSSAATVGGEHREESRPQEPHRRLSSFEGLWNLVPGSVATFPRRSGGGGALERANTTTATMNAEDELHEDQKEAEQVSHAQTQSSSASGSGSGFTGLSDLLRSRSRDPTPVPAPPASSSSSTTSKLGNVLGTTIKAASKWKTIRGPSSFHPIPSSFTEEQTPPAPTRSGYALRHPFIEDADDFTPPGFRPPPLAKPFVITHASPFAPSTTTTSALSGSSSLSPPRRGLMGAPLTGAPGFRAEDTYLGSTRPVSSTTDDDRRQGGAGGMGGVGVGNADADAGEKNGSSTDGQYGSSAGAERREWTGTKLVGRREGTDVVLDQAGADALRPFLPPRQRLSRTWTMLYSTDQHGASLTTFYRLLETNSRKNPQAGNVLVVRDAAGRRFGVFMNEGIRRAEGTYTGSGESWLFKLFQEDDDDSRTRAHVFRWTGKNHYFALCESEFITFGGGDGRYGLWIDKNLYHGSSAPCPAYDNEVLCAPPGSKAQRGNFECYGLEVWATS